MNYSIICSSVTGNTKLLADKIYELIKEKCIYHGQPDDKALEADVIFIGFWTNEGTCDKDIDSFLSKTKNKQVFIFGTCGFDSQDYFQKILETVYAKVDGSNKILGGYMCPGKMRQSVRDRYVKMAENPAMKSRAEMLIKNFDKVLTRPDQSDMNNLETVIKNIIY